VKYLRIKHYYQCEYSGLQHKLKVYPEYRLDGILYENVNICQRCFAAFIFNTSIGNIDISRLKDINKLEIRRYEFKKLSKLLQHQAAMKRSIVISQSVMSARRVQGYMKFAEEIAEISRLERKKHTKQNIWRMSK